MVRFCAGLWLKWNPRIYDTKRAEPRRQTPHKRGFPTVSQKWLDKPLDPTTLFLCVAWVGGRGCQFIFAPRL